MELNESLPLILMMSCNIKAHESDFDGSTACTHHQKHYKMTPKVASCYTHVH